MYLFPDSSSMLPASHLAVAVEELVVERRIVLPHGVGPPKVELELDGLEWVLGKVCGGVGHVEPVVKLELSTVR